MKDFKDIMNEISNSGHATDIILGSGFSDGLFNDGALQYPSLLDKVFTSVENASLQKLLQKNKDTYSNLEYYLKIMHDSEVCLPFLNNTDYLNLANYDARKLKDDAKILKSCIIDMIGKIHPHTWTPEEVKLKNCASNLLKFRRIYTLSYDLILYWTIQMANKIHKENTGKNKFIDGMWIKSDNRNLKKFSDSYNAVNTHYLHGAIHLITDENGDTCKIIKTAPDDNNINLSELLSSIKENFLELEYSNLMVLEGSSSQKISIIGNNPYLHKGLQRLSRNNSNSNIIIYGCSIVEKDTANLNNDSHVWQRVINSSFNTLYIGIYDKNKFSETKKSISDALSTISHNDIRDKKIEFFSTKNNDLYQENESISG